MVQAPDLSLSSRMALLTPGLSCVPFFKLPYNQQVSLESSQAIVLELELKLLRPGRAFLTISSRLWGVGLVKLTCYMCVLLWKPSFLSQDNLLSRYELPYPSFGLLFWVPSDLGIFFWALASPAMSLPFHRAMPSLLGGPPAWSGGSWLGCLDLPAMGAVSIWELAANSGSSWMSQAPNLHFARQLLNRYMYLVTDFLLCAQSLICTVDMTIIEIKVQSNCWAKLHSRSPETRA